MRPASLATRLGLGFGLALLAAGRTGASPTIHVVIAADTLDAKVGKSVALDQSAMLRAFELNVPGAMLRARMIEGDECRPESILAVIGRLAAGPGDAVVVYFSGHGGFDRRVGPYLRFPRREAYLTRDKLRLAIQGRNPRLGVLLTDCCNNLFAIPGTPSLGMPTPERPRVGLSPLFRSLFVDHAGFVDLTSSKEGEQSIGYPGLRLPKDSPLVMPGTVTDRVFFTRGGLFTTALTDIFSASRDEPLTWSRIGEATAGKVAAEFRRLRPDGLEDDDPEHPQMTQTVTAYSTGTSTARPDRRPAFGALGAENGGDGIRIEQAFAGTPAADLLLEPGDVVLTINGAPLRTLQDYARQNQGSPRIMRFTFRDVRTGIVKEAAVRLDRRQPGLVPASMRRSAFGAAATENGGSGVFVLRSEEGSPAADLGLERGDVILTVNNAAVRTVPEYLNAVRVSAAVMQFTFRDARTGVVKSATVKLDR